jgi:hypothetical protein
MDADVVTYYHCFDRWFARHHYSDFQFSEWIALEQHQAGAVARRNRARYREWQDPLRAPNTKRKGSQEK